MLAESLCVLAIKNTSIESIESTEGLEETPELCHPRPRMWNDYAVQRSGFSVRAPELKSAVLVRQNCLLRFTAARPTRLPTARARPPDLLNLGLGVSLDFGVWLLKFLIALASGRLINHPEFPEP